MTTLTDILIVGGGPVGATLALALRGYGHAVTVLEARPAADRSGDPRALALSEGSRMLLDRLGVWQVLAPCATSINTIHVSQRGRWGRTVMHAQEQGQEALGYVLPYAALSNALDDMLSRTPEIKVEHGAHAVAVETAPQQALVRFERGGTSGETQARLVVLADGGRSLDLLPDMKREVREYGHSAVIGHVECELPHANVAYERFTPQGPLALLPEGERGFALVWTAETEAAQMLCDMAEPEFLARLHQHFGDRVGQFISISNRAEFPLKLSTVRPVTAPHLVVIGNAAQTLHPVAGQGFNLGLRDAWELALTLQNTTRDNIGAADMLAQYRARRRLDTVGGIFFTDFLVRAFSNDIPGMGVARGAGLALVELLAPARRLVARKMSFGAHG